MALPQVRTIEIEEKETATGSRPRPKLALAVTGAMVLLGASAAILTKPRVGQRAPAVAVRAESEAAGLTFENFVQKYGRRWYVPGSEEYARRAAIFQESRAEIEAINAQQEQFWRAGPNHFMDWTVEERRAMLGYDKRAKRATMKAMTVDEGGNGGPPEGWTPPESGGMSIRDPRGPEVRDQGQCGSCWAFASASAAEAYILKADTDEKYTPSQVFLSTQVLVDCVENPNHCGGGGGCQGATQDLAYEFMRDHGIPLEQEVPYKGDDGQCVEHHMQGFYPASQLARVTGWRDLPSNTDQRPLMYELLNGPVTVGVAADRWFLYFGGVFDCKSDTGIDHAVVAKGFGKQDYPYPFNAKLYWLIQNSWGEGWGEQGHIKLMRESDEAEVCGTDEDTSIGMACDNDTATAKVCGACGILYAAIVPVGVTLGEASAPSFTVV